MSALPELIPTGAITLRRERLADVDLAASTVLASLDHLRPWMPWATPEAATVTAQRERIIHCDAANIPSQRIPQRLDYRLDRVEDDEVEAPAEVGRSMIWIFPPSQ